MQTFLYVASVIIAVILVVAEVLTLGQVVKWTFIILPVGAVLFIVWIQIEEKMEDYADEKQRKERTAKAKATKEKKKLAAKEGYKEALKKLEAIKNEFEKDDEPLKEKFFIDAIKLASDVSLLKKEDVEDGGSVFSILKFARLNVFTAITDEEKAQEYADKLGDSLKKLNSYNV